jgi:site-specific DNA recombinase
MGVKCCIYTRISQDRGGDELGVERQRADSQELADRFGYEVVRVFTDNDLSAYAGKPRPQYSDMLENYVRTGHVAVVIAWHPDRLHRHPRELEAWIDACEPAGVIVRTVKAGEYDLSTPAGQMNARILGAVARNESQQKGQRVARAYAQRIANGGYGGGKRRFGFEGDGITLRAKEAAEVSAATLAVLAGRSLRSIANDLNARGVPTSTGHKWDYRRLRTTLLRAMNAGIIEYKGQEVGRMPAAIVPEGQWRECVRLLEGNSAQYATASNKVAALGSGLYLCGACQPERAPLRIGVGGNHVRHEGQRDRRNRSYRCERANHLRQAQAPLDKFVENAIVERLSLPDAADLFTRPDEPDLTGVYAERQVLAGRLEELGSMFAAGDIDASTLRAGTADIRARMAQLDARIMSAESRNPLAAVAGQADVGEAWAALDLAQKRAILMTLMTVTVMPTRTRGPAFDPHRVDIEWKTA